MAASETANIFLSTIILASVVLNTTACYIILFKVKKKKLTHLFIISISVANLIESIVGLTPQLFISNELILVKTPLCVINSFAIMGLAITSITHISVLSLIRIVVIKYPIFYYKTCKKMWCKVILISICYIYGFGWATVPLIGWSKYVLDLDKMRFSLDWKLTQADSLSFILTLLVFCNILPGAVIALTTYIGTKTISKQKSNEVSQTEKEKPVDILEKYYLRVFTLSALMFFVIWTPYAIVGILTLSKFVIPTHFVTVAALFAKLSTISNVLINCFINKSFQNQLLSLGIIQAFINKSKRVSPVFPEK
ncbi:uncharacterized protein LOC101236896 [Hydra vulgaris]|uniref:Opsin n=1 Tax=Hydra vulgaris TaxID=6087 RepID=F1LIP3_HYDVU|nr:uncharacterized protein LOC101236896 [Hydra vulgaris]QHF16593.1 opsin [Hydra vulgaris]BAD67146.1 opsin [Hydra vulgaris]